MQIIFGNNFHPSTLSLSKRPWRILFYTKMMELRPLYHFIKREESNLGLEKYLNPDFYLKTTLAKSTLKT